MNFSKELVVDCNEILMMLVKKIQEVVLVWTK